MVKSDHTNIMESKHQTAVSQINQSQIQRGHLQNSIGTTTLSSQGKGISVPPSECVLFGAIN